MTRQQALEDLFLTVRKYLINEGRSEEAARIVATMMYKKVADNSEMTIKDIKRIRDIFIAQEVDICDIIDAFNIIRSGD